MSNPRGTYYALQVKHADDGWLTYCGIFDVDSLQQASDRALTFGKPSGPREYIDYRVIDLRTNETMGLPVWL